MRTTIFLPLALTCAVAGCGGNGTSAAPSRAGTTPAQTQSASASVAFVVKIPNRSANAGTRARHYVGDGTKSATIAATAAGASTAAVQQTVNCAATCAATLALVPGTYTFTVALYNGTNGSGSLLSSGTAHKTIVAGIANTVNIAFTGSIARADVELLDPSGTGELAVGTPAVADVFVDAQDADGNIVIGTYDKPIVLTSSDGTDAALSAPAPTATAAPGFDSSPPPVPAAQPNAASITIVDSDQQPVLTWTGNGTSLYDVIVTAKISGTTSADYATLSVTGGATAPPFDNPVDPEFTPPPLVPLGSASPTTTVAHPKGAAPPPAAGSAVTVAALGVPTSLASLTAQGTSLYGFVGGTAQTVSLALGSQVNLDPSGTPVTGALQQMNFAVSTNASGLNTFARGGRARVLDLNAYRRNAPRDRGPVDFHQTLKLDPRKALGHGIAKRGRFAFSGMPAVGTQSTWNVGSSTQAVTARTIINDAKTGNPRFVVWTANSSMVPDAMLATFVQMTKNADAAITTAEGDFHYPANAPGIKTYATCDANGNNTGSGPGIIADPGYVNIVVYDGTQNTGLPNAAGFFGANDYATQPTFNCINSKTNEAPTIYVLFSPNTTLDASSLEFLQAVFTHEYSHLVTYVQKAILRGGTLEYSWLIEGMGTFAQDYTSPLALAGNSGPLGAPTAPVYDVNATLNRLPPFFASPQNYSLTGFAGVENGTYTAGGGTNYGLSYLFVRYCADRFGNKFFTDLNSSPNVGVANITYAAQQNGGGNITFAQLYQDFITMLAVSGTNIPHDPKYDLKWFNIRGGFFPEQCPGCGSVTLIGPQTVTTLSPGQTMVVQNMFASGQVFFGMNGINAAGNVIRVDDTNNGALQLYGALGQM